MLAIAAAGNRTFKGQSMQQAVIAEPRAGWMKIILNRPDKLNALSPDLHQGVVAALDAAEADPACRALLLTGAGRGFCAGQELGAEVQPGPNGEPPDVRAILNRWNPVIRRIRGMAIPVVCAVNGVAAGAGANIALACDLVLAAKSARFIQSFIKVGLVPDAGGSFRGARKIASQSGMRKIVSLVSRHKDSVKTSCRPNIDRKLAWMKAAPCPRAR